MKVLYIENAEKLHIVKMSPDTLCKATDWYTDTRSIIYFLLHKLPDTCLTLYMYI